jgi:hypothetical protein
VFLAAPAFRNGNNVIELDLVVLQMFAAVLAGVVIAPYDPHLRLKRNIPACSTIFGGFGPGFGGEHYGADVTKDRALHFGNYWRDRYWVILRIERADPLLKRPASDWINPTTVSKTTCS